MNYPNRTPALVPQLTALEAADPGKVAAWARFVAERVNRPPPPAYEVRSFRYRFEQDASGAFPLVKFENLGFPPAAALLANWYGSGAGAPVVQTWTAATAFFLDQVQVYGNAIAFRVGGPGAQQGLTFRFTVIIFEGGRNTASAAGSSQEQLLKTLTNHG